MKKHEVPQQNAKAFMGHSKLLYATDAQGRYEPAPCNGWEAEEIVLDQAIAEYVRQAEDAWRRARAGDASSLEYHMFRQRMDVVLLAQSTGFFKWRVRRDLRPGAFQRLSPARRERYADALGTPAAELGRLPERP